MFSGNNNRSPHCPRGQRLVGNFLSPSKHGIYDGTRSSVQLKQPETRTFVTSATTSQFTLTLPSVGYIHHGKQQQKQYYHSPTHPQLDKFSNNQPFGFAAFTAQHQITASHAPSSSSWHTNIAQMMPSGQQKNSPPKTENFPGFLDGIKQLVNGIINPININLYKEKGLDKKCEQNSKIEKSSAAGAADVVRVVSGKHDVNKIDINDKLKQHQQQQENLNGNNTFSNTPSNAADVIALFTADDFPELPVPRRQIAQMSPMSPSSSTAAAAAGTTSLNSVPVDKKPKRISSSELNSTESTKIPVFDLSAKLAATITPLNLVSNPKYCFFEIQFQTVHTRNYPKLSSFSMLSRAPSKNTNSQKLRNDDDDDNNRRKSIQMVFCDSDDDDDDSEEDCVRLIQSQQQMQNVVPDGDFGLGLSISLMNRPQRQRQISECSDDSFVVCFAEDAGDGLQMLQHDETDGSDEVDGGNSDFEDDEYATSSDDNDDDDDENESILFTGSDVVDASLNLLKNIPDTMPSIQNLKTDICKSVLKSKISEDENSKETIKLDLKGVCIEKQPDSGFDEDKKVRFNLQLEIHVIRAWNFAYRAARKGHWEDYARDRDRFRKRIERTAVFLNPILSQQHREKIYQSRFCNLDEDSIATK